MHVDLRLLLRTAILWGPFVKHVHNIVMRLVELRLCKVRKQAAVASVAVDDQNFLAAVTRHLVGGFLEECELESAAVGHAARLVFGLGNLSEIVLGEDDSVFPIGCVQRGVADIEEIGSERKMRSVFLQDAEREQADSLRAVNAFAEVEGREFFPVDGKLRLRRGRLSVDKGCCAKNEG